VTTSTSRITCTRWDRDLTSPPRRSGFGVQRWAHLQFNSEIPGPERHRKRRPLPGAREGTSRRRCCRRRTTPGRPSVGISDTVDACARTSRRSSGQIKSWQARWLCGPTPSGRWSNSSRNDPPELSSTPRCVNDLRSRSPARAEAHISLEQFLAAWAGTVPASCRSCGRGEPSGARRPRFPALADAENMEVSDADLDAAVG